MRCHRCDHENPPQAKFCLECGARVALACAQCGTELPPGAKFCFDCGQPVGPPLPVQSRFSGTPEGYTPGHLAEKILTSRRVLEGERKQVTVLFADVKGSMELVADLDPEKARELLDRAVEPMMEAVHRYEGTVTLVMGDGIMALFGAPLAHEDHAIRACYAALGMQAGVTRLGDELQRSHGVPLQIRVGLNSGEVVVGSIGNDLHMDYTAIGQTVHLASRMEQMAKPGSILATANTLKLAEGYVEVKPLGPVTVKGLDQQIEVHEVTAAGVARTRLQAATARGLTPLIGRDAEVEQLGLALEQAGQGHGQVVALVGEPGVGKSRLFHEFISSHRTHGWSVLESASVSYGKATLYFPIVELLRAYFRIAARDDHRTIREKVTGRLLTLDRALEPALPAFLTLLDVPVEDPRWDPLDPRERRQRTLDAMKRLLLRESQVQPLCLVFEDLHWIDSETQALLDSLIESLPTTRTLLLLNYRPEYQHAWGSKTYYTQLRVDPLPPESAEDLLGALLGDDPGLQPLRQLLVARTEGNPFFLEESVQALVDVGALAGERGAYRLARTLPSIQVPATVQAVLAARIDRLPAEEKQLLQTAAVIGKDVPFVLLQALVGESEAALRLRLSHLQAFEFLYEASLFPELEYTFKHALTHEVAYGSLLQERRRALHARVVEAIERTYPERLAEQVDRLAHHARGGEVWDKAVLYFQQAGAKADDRSALREAAVYFEEALSALTHLPASREAGEQAFDLRLAVYTSLRTLGELPRAEEHLRAAEALAAELGDQRRLGIVFARKGGSWLQGNPRDAVEAAQRALAIAREVRDSPLEIRATYVLGMAYASMGAYRRASEGFRTNVESLQGDLLHQRFGTQAVASVQSRAWLAWCLAELGEFHEGIALGEEAWDIAEAAAHPFSFLSPSFGLGLVHLRQGSLARAIAVLERGLRIAEDSNFPALGFYLIASFLGAAYALSGRLSEALPLLERVADESEAVGLVFNQLLAMIPLGEAYLLAGRRDEAMETAVRGLALARQHAAQGTEAWALRLVGEIAAHGDPSDAQEAEEPYQQAIALAEELGMRPLLAHCHLGLGTLYRGVGRIDEARAALADAVHLFRTMEMTLWLPQAETALAGVG